MAACGTAYMEHSVYPRRTQRAIMEANTMHSLDALDDSVKALSLEGVEATAENIKAGNYFLSRPFVMATKGEISEQNDLVQAWFDYVMGDEGQQIASEVGLITVK